MGYHWKNSRDATMPITARNLLLTLDLAEEIDLDADFRSWGFLYGNPTSSSDTVISQTTQTH